MGIKRFDNNWDLVKGISEIIMGVSSIPIINNLSDTILEEAPIALFLFYSASLFIIVDGQRRIRQYIRENQNNYKPEMCEFHYLPRNRTVWDNIPDITYKIE